MKVLLDTNIIVDVALERQPFYAESLQVLSMVYHKRVKGYISASSFSDIYYIVRKAKGRDLTLDFLERMATLCQIASVNQAAIEMAFNANFRDFEDAIQYSSAVINQLDAIVTRNPRDFAVSAPRILTPNQLIQEITDSP